MDLKITRTSTAGVVPDDIGARFGADFTDHMFLMNYRAACGWHDHRIVPFGPIPLHPAASALQYGQAIFDGCKAYRCDDAVVRLFRPQAHIERINRSAARMCMPPVDPHEVLEAMIQLVDIDRRWMPKGGGKALYLRPTMIGTEGFLSVRPAEEYLFMLFLSPVGDYYAEGIAPVRILVSDTHVRAARGGIGAAKAAANYGASLLATDEAKRKGHTQVLWLDAVERRFIEEVGTMNVMMKIGDVIVTPPLSDSILPGVTRASSLQLLREWGHAVDERPVAIDELLTDIRAGNVDEVWGVGTAAVVSPIGALTYKDETFVVGEGGAGAVTRRLHEAITRLHRHAGDDPYGWRVEVPSRSPQA